ncbi:hypothetical protein ONA91_11370 [Micromonospora sp. DR5-3]|uniref:hypothetical protein n=1 Tax=unclassified Micromonospora TaxID=2617518 RepID=UPI0011D5BF1E|nr:MULTISPECIES: hypothetical protein [unclassified Micromonospora]MCW3815055.1 hypothetical protein [Micromonospora sp. DR5-3]TYC25369.1 hypothetical protein FXF52_06120 [Micromonospora sp. MP36]
MAAPVIRSVTANPAVLLPGKSATVVVDAYHPDSRVLAFSGRVGDPTGGVFDSSVRIELAVPLTIQLTTAAPGVTVTPNATDPSRFTVTVLSGRGAVTLTATVRDPAGRTATAATTVTVPLLVGMSTEKGAPTQQIVANYPNLRYMRDYGVDTDGDKLPELPPLNAGKFVDAPSAIMHVSWKDSVEQLSTWLNGLARPVYLTWYHEPMGDVTPATYRTTGTRLSQIVAAHPNRKWVLGHGPIVTRYWLDEGGGNPTDWGYPGMTHYGVDCYSRDTATYWPASRIFGTAFGKVRAAYPGVRLLVPEYGLVRTTADKTGTGRAQAMKDHVTWLRQQAYVDAVAYWNNWAEFQLAYPSPEATAWRDLQNG